MHDLCVCFGKGGDIRMICVSVSRGAICFERRMPYLCVGALCEMYSHTFIGVFPAELQTNERCAVKS